MTSMIERMSSAEDDTVVIETRYGPLRLPGGMLGLWNEYGWPPDQVIREMASEPRYRP